MKYININVRETWKYKNELFDVNVQDIREGKLNFEDYCDEEPFYIDTPININIDVEWGGIDLNLKYPAKNVHLVGIICEDDYNNPIEKRKFIDIENLKKWIKNWIKKIEEMEDEKIK